MTTSLDSTRPILLVIYCSGDRDPVDTDVVKWRYRPTLDLTYEMIYWQKFLYTNTYDTIQELLYAFGHPRCISLFERHTNIIGIFPSATPVPTTAESEEGQTGTAVRGVFRIVVYAKGYTPIGEEEIESYITINGRQYDIIIETGYYTPLSKRNNSSSNSINNNSNTHSPSHPRRGSSIAYEQSYTSSGGFGTIGCIVTHKETGKRYAVTSKHVITPPPPPPPPPPTTTTTTTTTTSIQHYRQSSTIQQYTDSNNNNSIDMPLALFSPAPIHRKFDFLRYFNQSVYDRDGQFKHYITHDEYKDDEDDVYINSIVSKLDPADVRAYIKTRTSPPPDFNNTAASASIQSSNDGHSSIIINELNAYFTHDITRLDGNNITLIPDMHLTVDNRNNNSNNSNSNTSITIPVSSDLALIPLPTEDTDCSSNSGTSESVASFTGKLPAIQSVYTIQNIIDNFTNTSNTTTATTNNTTSSTHSIYSKTINVSKIGAATR